MQYERSEHFALQASELTALPFPNRGVVSLTDRKIFLPHRDQQSHFHIRPVRGPDLAAGFLANFTFHLLDLCGLQQTALVAQEGERLAEFAANAGKSSDLVG